MRPDDTRAQAAVRLLLLAVVTSLSLSMGCAPAPSRPAAASRVDHRPERPHPHARWVEGHWTYQQGRYLWVRGGWAR